MKERKEEKKGRRKENKREDRSQIKSRLPVKTTRTGKHSQLDMRKIKRKENESPQTESWIFTPSVSSLWLLDGELQTQPTTLTGSYKTYTHVRNPGRVGPKPEHNVNQLFSALPHTQPINSYNYERQQEKIRRWNCTLDLA